MAPRQSLASLRFAIEVDVVRVATASGEVDCHSYPVAPLADGTITDTFVQIVVKNEAVQTVLNDQAAVIQKTKNDGNIKCWGPEGTWSGACQVN